MKAVQSLIAVLIVGAAPATAQADLDVAFLLDTTGSMSGELREAKQRVRQLAQRLAEARPNERIRIGVVAYRDRGDAYVTRISPLAGDIETSFSFLAGLSAGGGGDGPEDVVSGLEAALFQLEWDLADGVERQVFLIGDAPPHLDYQDHPAPELLFKAARERRIVINAIGCRSLPRNGVQFFRRVAYATEGRYQHIGHVRGGGRGVTGAMLSALTGDDAALEKSARVIAARLDNVRPADRSPGLLVTLVPGDAGKGKKACAIDVDLPKAMGLDTDPEVRHGAGRLFVRLRPSTAPTEAFEPRTLRFHLGTCVPRGLPVHVRFGG